jgi:hypothetical protein
MREVLDVATSHNTTCFSSFSSRRCLDAWGALLLCWVCLLGAPRAFAQSCHSGSLRPTSGLTYRVALSSVFGTFTRGDVKGEYQGLFVTGTVSHPWFTAELTAPGYRIAQTGSHAYGIGDLALNVRGNVYRSDDQSITLGPELAVTLPTGSSQDGLGMGHVMLMPGGFVAWQQGAFTLVTQLAYGRALGSPGGHVHEQGPWPIVNPMNRSELTHAIGFSASVHPNLRLTGRLLGAVTLFNHGGAAREIVAPGLQLIAGAFDFALEQQLPIAGTPFVSRTLMSVGAQW